MMKVAIIAFNNMKYSPYVKTYTDFFDEKGIEYNIIYPNRDNMTGELQGEHYPIFWDKKKNKALNFLSFRKQTIALLKKNKYDFVIVLTTFPAVLLSTFLSKHYQGRYLVDIRDYTHENNAIYFHYEKKVLASSLINVISSPGFKSFLPSDEYVLCHNMSLAYSQPVNTFRKRDGKIVLGYIGSIAYAAWCKQLIDLVVKDERFCFYFYGNEKGDMPVHKYVEELACDRIRCFGEYSPQDKEQIIQSVDILFNVYGNSNLLVQHALSNKLYDGFYFKKPILTSPNTVMSTLCGPYSFDIDNSTENLDALYKWYMALDGEKLVSYMNERFTAYKADMDKFYKVLENIVEKNK